eukprot:4592419-Amphidinium_carterae.1
MAHTWTTARTAKFTTSRVSSRSSSPWLSSPEDHLQDEKVRLQSAYVSIIQQEVATNTQENTADATTPAQQRRANGWVNST